MMRSKTSLSIQQKTNQKQQLTFTYKHKLIASAAFGIVPTLALIFLHFNG